MQSIKNCFLKGRRLFSNPKRFLLFCLALCFAVLSFYFVISLLSIGRAELALAALKKSYEQETLCHESCYLWREGREKIIINNLKTEARSSSRVAQRILTYWLDENINQEFKKELIKIIYNSSGANNPPAYLKEYLLSPGANKELVQEIISAFSLDEINSQKLSQSLLGTIKNATSSVEKVEALKVLGKLNNDLEIDNYFFLLSSGEAGEVKREAIKNISAIREKSSVFTLAQLAEIKDLILDSATDKRLRQELVLLVGDYYLVYPKESEKVWRDTLAEKKLDSISRLFSADNLNHLVGAKLSLPLVSPDEWANYYNE
jgi:hypothetical protein